MVVVRFPACKERFPRMVSSEATGMPEGKRIRGNTMGVPSQSALPREVYQSSRRGAVCDRRFRASHMPNIIAKWHNARNPRRIVRRTRVLFGSCTFRRLVHVLVPLRAFSRHIDDTVECTENDTGKQRIFYTTGLKMQERSPSAHVMPPICQAPFGLATAANPMNATLLQLHNAHGLGESPASSPPETGECVKSQRLGWF